MNLLQHIQQYWIDYAFGLIVGALALAYKSLWNKLQKTKRENEGMKNGIKALLHDRIIAMGKELVAKRSCTPEEFEDFEYLYKPYHDDLEGNGSAERMHNTVKTLPPE